MTRREVLQEVEAKARELGGLEFFQWLHAEAEKPEQADAGAGKQEQALSALLVFLAAPERTTEEIEVTLAYLRANMARAAEATT